MLNFKKKFVVVVAVVLIHFNTLGEEGRGFFNPMYFLFTVSWPYKRGSLLATVYGTLFSLPRFLWHKLPIFSKLQLCIFSMLSVKCACTKLPLLQ